MWHIPAIGSVADDTVSEVQGERRAKGAAVAGTMPVHDAG
jgi:hypothetical protein